MGEYALTSTLRYHALCAIQVMCCSRKEAPERSREGNGRVEGCVTSPKERAGIPAAASYVASF